MSAAIARAEAAERERDQARALILAIEAAIPGNTYTSERNALDAVLDLVAEREAALATLARVVALVAEWHASPSSLVAWCARITARDPVTGKKSLDTGLVRESDGSMIEHDRWSLEIDDNGTRDVWRIVAASAREARKRSGSSARPDYVATVYSLEAARHILSAQEKLVSAHERIARLVEELANSRENWHAEHRRAAERVVK